MGEIFYASSDDIGQKDIIISGEEARHIAKVMRHKKGDRVTIVDGRGGEYNCFLQAVSDHSVTAQIVNITRKSREPIKRVTLAQAVPKGRMDFVVEKGTEIGLCGIIPLITANSVVRGPDEKAPPLLPGMEQDADDGKIGRWQRIAVSAMKQSLRSVLPEIHPYTDFKTLIAGCDEYDLAVMADENERKRTVAQVFGELHKEARKILCIVGPEGGFTEEETKLAQDKKISTVTLGSRRLRAETAGLVLSTLVLYELGDME